MSYPHQQPPGGASAGPPSRPRRYTARRLLARALFMIAGICAGGAFGGAVDGATATAVAAVVGAVLVLVAVGLTAATRGGARAVGIGGVVCFAVAIGLFAGLTPTAAILPVPLLIGAAVASTFATIAIPPPPSRSH